MTSPAVGSDLAVSLRHICKGYPGVQALDAVSLDVRFGEVHAIVGENGAGKSTLLKILSGLVAPDCGTVQVSGTTLKPHTTIAARRLGVRVVPQDVLVVQGLIAGRNVTLGQERWNAHRGRLAQPERAAVREAMDLAGLTAPARRPSSRLSVPEQRLLQIAAGLYGAGKVLVLDEPTAVVSEADSAHLLQRLNALREQGMAILYVSHRLTEVLTIADRVTVLRDGRKVAENPRAEVTREGLIRHMTKVSASPAPTPGGTAASGRRHELAEATGSEVRVEASAPPRRCSGPA
jgi:ABC-type sugar transport system ATPase subunit